MQEQIHDAMRYWPKERRQNFRALIERHLPTPDDTRRDDDGRMAAPLDLSRAVLTFTDLLQRTLPTRRYWLPWLPERGIAMVYGRRGVGKTMFALDAALSLATGTPLLGWESTPTEVLYIDGEMALESIRDRLVQLAGPRQPHGLHLLASEEFYAQFARDLRLTDAEARAEVDRFLDHHPAISVLFLDNISTLFAGMSEDKKQDWEPINAWLIRLRHRGISPVLVHHAGKSGQQRGTSGREDILDTVIALREPPDYDPTQGCWFHLAFTKSRGVAGDAVQSLDVKLVSQDVDGTPMLTWEVKPLEVSQRAQILALLGEGENSTRVIAEDVGCSERYVRKIRRELEGSNT